VLYFAYGSNLNVLHMAQRCPAAIPVGRFYLPHARLVFRGVADCIADANSQCPGGIWKITPECEQALDHYEGIAGGLYRKVFLPIAPIDDETELMLYTMHSEGIYPPSQVYLDSIKQGYRDFNLPLASLRAAVKASWVEKAPSDRELRRHRRNGRPPLGQSATVRP
jgi:hypothetical protein